MAIVLTFDGAVGSRVEVVDGHYTGREGGPFTYREGKAEAIRELAEREASTSRRRGRTPTRESDLPMLRLVGHPVAVNPDKELAARRARGGLGGHALRAPRAAAAGGVAAIAAAVGRRRGAAVRRRARA